MTVVRRSMVGSRAAAAARRVAISTIASPAAPSAAAATSHAGRGVAAVVSKAMDRASGAASGDAIARGRSGDM